MKQTLFAYVHHAQICSWNQPGFFWFV